MRALHFGAAPFIMLLWFGVAPRPFPRRTPAARVVSVYWGPSMLRLSALFIAALLAFVPVLPASAVQPLGSAAWTTDGWTSFDGIVYSGPGRNYDEVGTITAGERIRVERCTRHFCQFHTASLHGWISLYNVSFGQKPDGWFVGPKFPVAGGATVCFYTGQNYTGASFCLSPGQLKRDLSLVGHDNAISSIDVGTGGKAMVCRDRFFHSYCVIIDANKPHLEKLLADSISAIRVY